MTLSNSIFTQDDIRGIYPSELDDAGAYALGRAYATLLQRELDEPVARIAVGTDAEPASLALKAELITVLLILALACSTWGSSQCQHSTTASPPIGTMAA